MTVCDCYALVGVVTLSFQSKMPDTRPQFMMEPSNSESARKMDQVVRLKLRAILSDGSLYQPLSST